MRIDPSHSGRAPFCLRSPHVIRLQGPWHWEIRPSSEPPIAASPAATAAARDRRRATFQAPDGLSQILATTSAGRLRLTRFFHYPSGLDINSSVELVIEPMAAQGVVRLNSVPLGPQRHVSRFAIVELLRNTNELQLDLELESIAGQTMARPRVDVRLEIV